uniref:E3 ubiquitin-protein ligase n=1 Tax=Canis lupus familiaris TaxID=9615 RepID=A0A8I3MAR9_CANLF
MIFFCDRQLWDLMAGCGEVDHSINMLPTNRKANESCSNTAPSLTVPECAICLQTCVHPVSLPCKHVFCYLCVKGASWLGKRCALCRQEIPEDFLDKPTLLSPEELKAASRGNGEYAWYYEGRNGWWQYDERTSRELEDAFSKGKKSTEMLIAGFLYVADLENMVQYRRNEHGRRRKIKRDIIDIPKKGVAGLRLDCDSSTVNLARESSADGADSVPAQSGASVQPLASSARPPASVDGPLTSPATPSPDASTSLEDSFAHLHLGGDSIAERSHRGEGEEDHESPSSGRVPAPDTSVEETESDASSESEEVPALGAQHSLTHQRLLVPSVNQTVSDRSDRSGTDRPVAGGGTVNAGVRSRRPDGQCTVTEV